MAKLLDHIWPSCWTRHGQAAGPNMAKLVDQIRPRGCRPDMAKRLDQIWPSGCRPDMAKRLDQIWPSGWTKYGQAARPDMVKLVDQIGWGKKYMGTRGWWHSRAFIWEIYEILWAMPGTQARLTVWMNYAFATPSSS